MGGAGTVDDTRSHDPSRDRDPAPHGPRPQYRSPETALKKAIGPVGTDAHRPFLGSCTLQLDQQWGRFEPVRVRACRSTPSRRPCHRPRRRRAGGTRGARGPSVQSIVSGWPSVVRSAAPGRSHCAFHARLSASSRRTSSGWPVLLMQRLCQASRCLANIAVGCPSSAPYSVQQAQRRADGTDVLPGLQRRAADMTDGLFGTAAD